MIFDSNIFIYAGLPDYFALRQWCLQQSIEASEITRLEVLGYHKLSEADQHDLSQLFSLTKIHPISSTVIDKAIALRQQRKISLGDAIIAATALHYRSTLVTRNVEDFGWITGLSLFNPFGNDGD